MKLFNYSEKSVIITGGGTGIGFEIAKSFLMCGAKITIVGRRNDVLENAVNQLKKLYPKLEKDIFSLSCDMSDEDSVRNLFNSVKSTYNQIDILINNCGKWSLTKIDQINSDEIDDHYNNILKSTILGTKFATEFLEDSGSIVNVGSFAGILPMKNASMYSSFKTAIKTFTKSSAAELGFKGIRVNCVIPGVIRTPMTADYIDENYAKIIEPISLGRVGECKEVANGVLFLCSDLASYITGTSIEITGGKFLTQL